MSSDDTLKRVEELLEYIVRKLERLEELLTTLSNDPTYAMAVELTLYFSIPVQRAVKLARELVILLKGVPESDPITKAILEVLASSESGVSISELTRRVRRVRGTASRRIISERIKLLESRGIVEVVRSGNVAKVYLRRGLTHGSLDSG
ncbi:MAG: ArsR family transcriptional regulator [Desulfurococcaceae archaeon]|jgi:DNA-binding transcriptional ArsR family regulator|nr:ArsR family transcriptional regulator [Desulfurococcaceae archaeon]